MFEPWMFDELRDLFNRLIETVGSIKDESIDIKFKLEDINTKLDEINLKLDNRS